MFTNPQLGFQSSQLNTGTLLEFEKVLNCWFSRQSHLPLDLEVNLQEGEVASQLGHQSYHECYMLPQETKHQTYTQVIQTSNCLLNRIMQHIVLKMFKHKLEQSRSSIHPRHCPWHPPIWPPASVLWTWRYSHVRCSFPQQKNGWNTQNMVIRLNKNSRLRFFGVAKTFKLAHLGCVIVAMPWRVQKKLHATHLSSISWKFLKSILREAYFWDTVKTNNVAANLAFAGQQCEWCHLDWWSAGSASPCDNIQLSLLGLDDRPGPVKLFCCSHQVWHPKDLVVVCWVVFLT